MHTLNEKGELLLPLVIVVVLFLASLGFGAWAFMGRQDYKNNVEAKVADAVAAAEENLSIEKDAEFAEKYKKPFSTYKGPSAFGTLTISYPKTWSNYVNDKGNSSAPLDGTMHPGYVPADSDTINYALRYQVVNRQYEQELKQFESKVKTGKVTVAAYRLPEQDSVLGSRIEGELDGRKQGTMIILPLRDKTVKIWTEGSEFKADFESILTRATFVP